MNSAQLIHDIWVDGGNTEGLLQEVKYAYSWDTYQLYANLMSNSPYLSDTVIISAINRVNVLTDTMIRNVLSANLQAIKITNILTDIENTRPAFYINKWIDELIDQTDTITPREQLEALISYYAQERQVAVDQLKRIYIEDTTGTYTIDSLITLLANDIEPISSYQLASIYLNNHDSVNYWKVMDSIPIKYQFAEVDMQSHQDFTDYFSIINTLIANNMDYTKLSYTQIQKLYDLTSRSSNYTAAYAREILLKADTTYTYNEPIILPDDNTRMMTKVSKPSIKMRENLLKVYPNPAKVHFVVEYNVVNDLNNATIEVIDMLGHKMQSIKLTAKDGQITINTSSYAKSMYVCYLKNNGKIISKTKVGIE